MLHARPARSARVRSQPRTRKARRKPRRRAMDWRMAGRINCSCGVSRAYAAASWDAKTSTRPPLIADRACVGGVQVIAGGLSRAVHSHAQIPRVEPLAMMEDEGFLLLHGERAKGTDECHVVRGRGISVRHQHILAGLRAMLPRPPGHEHGVVVEPSFRRPIVHPLRQDAQAAGHDEAHGPVADVFSPAQGVRHPVDAWVIRFEQLLDRPAGSAGERGAEGRERGSC